MASTVASSAFHFVGSAKAIAGEGQALHAVECRAKVGTVSHDAVLHALERILESDLFRRSTRLSRFLQFTVEQTLRGFGENLKEYRIATEVYERKADFDPAQDTIVRSEARRLRTKLKEYYEKDGKFDDVAICFRPGSYTPISQWRTTTARPTAVLADTLGESWSFEGEVEVVVKPFLSLAGDHAASELAFGISDELLHRLPRIAGIRVVRHTIVEGHRSVSWNACPQFTIDGTVRTVDGRLRVTARLTAVDGLVLWSERFNATGEAVNATNLPDVVAASIVTRISLREGAAS
jgi:TolB-like protein